MSGQSFSMSQALLHGAVGGLVGFFGNGYAYAVCPGVGTIMGSIGYTWANFAIPSDLGSSFPE